MSEPRVEHVAGADAAAQRAAELLAATIAGALAARGAAHVALSGGRTPRQTYSLLGPLVADWHGVHLWFADERCVAAEDPLSNSRLVRETLAAPGAVTHRIRGELGPDAAARAYERELADVVLDAALLGLGEDGHTASLFPGSNALDAPGRAAPVARAPTPPPQRVTLTRATLDGARSRVLLVTGAEKAPALAKTLGAPDPAVPASLLRRERTVVVTDQPGV